MIKGWEEGQGTLRKKREGEERGLATKTIDWVRAVAEILLLRALLGGSVPTDAS